ncbi:GatB/YqeY domain-containing protein [Pseudoruegeria sp. SK021]|uniref:GatB/YqeY domain-containing protein n=1 Tax=Pseudoruegeria sp. SK021 TaxID=1933035 RepID=UPI000A2386C7|nr:GatB/YqeY domain-containing protein [Pseudoruegeria sp. SK021]OSP56661.1 glutamyl-tRNA amidotransferase [Pseudoruegeria sp. SK021]
MSLKQKITVKMKQAMKDRDVKSLPTLRLIIAAIKDKEIACRGCEEGVSDSISEDEIRAILSKMVRQRRESEKAYEEAGRLELAEQEREEAKIIAGFLPKPLTEDEETAAIAAAITETGADSIRDMGKVMGLLKERHQGQMDFASVGPQVRARLSA